MYKCKWAFFIFPRQKGVVVVPSKSKKPCVCPNGWNRVPVHMVDIFYLKYLLYTIYPCRFAPLWHVCRVTCHVVCAGKLSRKKLLKSGVNSFDKFRQVGYNSRINRIFANISTDLGPVSFYRIAERCDYWIQVTRSAFCRFGQYFVSWQQVTFSSACFCFFR